MWLATVYTKWLLVFIWATQTSLLLREIEETTYFVLRPPQENKKSETKKKLFMAIGIGIGVPC